MTDLTVSQTILSQLGGGRFVAMTGAKDFVGSPDALTFRCARQWFRIALNGSDLYDVEAFTINRRTFARNVKQSRRDVFCGDLARAFTEMTGLHTSL